MFQVTVKRFFDSAHQLKDSENLITKKCANLHGHTYLAVVNLHAISNDFDGMVMDFSGIKAVIDKLDHQFINNIFEKDIDFHDKPTTAENIALWIWQEVMKDFGSRITKLTVSIYEGWKGEENSNFVSYGN